MNTAEKAALVEQSLTRAAEQVGDITQPAMGRYYRACPGAREAFATHARGNCAQLEGEMVERAVYCLMNWFESPGEVEMLLSGSVLHHQETLRVHPEWYAALIDAAADVIGETIPAQNSTELATWNELRAGLREVIHASGTPTRGTSGR